MHEGDAGEEKGGGDREGPGRAAAVVVEVEICLGFVGSQRRHRERFWTLSARSRSWIAKALSGTAKESRW